MLFSIMEDEDDYVEASILLLTKIQSLNIKYFSLKFSTIFVVQVFALWVLSFPESL